MLVRVLIPYLALTLLFLQSVGDLTNPVAAIALKVMKQTGQPWPNLGHAHRSPPGQIYYPVFLASLFCLSPWIAHQVRRRWFPKAGWRAAQFAALLFIIGGAAGHYLLFPAMLRHYLFPYTGPPFDFARSIFTLHAQCFLAAGIAALPAATLASRWRAPTP